MTLITYLVPKLLTVKDVVRKMSKNSRFRRLFNKQHGKPSQILLKYARQQLYQLYWSLWSKFSWKNSLLVIWKILGLFVNTLTTDDKYSVLNTVNSTLPIQMKLSKKQIFFCQFFPTFLKPRSKFEHFETKITLIAYVLPIL